MAPLTMALLTVALLTMAPRTMALLTVALLTTALHTMAPLTFALLTMPLFTITGPPAAARGELPCTHPGLAAGWQGPPPGYGKG